MKKNLVSYIWIVLLFPLVTSCGYNKLVTLDEESNNAWANVEDAYKRRADLIPNLQNIVEGSADFERETLENVIEARAKATQVNVDPATASPEQMQEFFEAQNGLGSALSRLLVTVERYPELKSTAAFQDFQAQLESTENRISVARQRFNESVRNYNTYRRGFPQITYSGLLGFPNKEYFEASEQDMERPDIDFDFDEDDDN